MYKTLDQSSNKVRDHPYITSAYFLTFYRPKSDVENIDEDNDKDDDIDIDEFDEDDLSYEGKEFFFIRQCLLLRMKGNDQKPNIKYFYRPVDRGVQLKGMGIRVIKVRTF